MKICYGWLSVLLVLTGLAAPVTVSADEFYPIVPCRLVDTRIAGGELQITETRDFRVFGDFEGDLNATQGGNALDCFIPSGVTAVEVTLSAVDPTGTGYMRAWPWGETEPNATLLQYTDIGGITNTTTVTVCGDSLFCANHFSLKNYGSTTHLVVDVVGFYDPFILVVE